MELYRAFLWRPPPPAPASARIATGAARRHLPGSGGRAHSIHEEVVVQKTELHIDLDAKDCAGRELAIIATYTEDSRAALSPLAAIPVSLPMATFSPATAASPRPPPPPSARGV